MTADSILDLETQLVLRAGHLPSCGEDAEFPWDCTCDYAGFMERMSQVLIVSRAAESRTSDGVAWHVADGHAIESVEVEHRRVAGVPTVVIRCRCDYVDDLSGYPEHVAREAIKACSTGSSATGETA